MSAFRVNVARCRALLFGEPAPTPEVGEVRCTESFTYMTSQTLLTRAELTCSELFKLIIKLVKTGLKMISGPTLTTFHHLFLNLDNIDCRCR